MDRRPKQKACTPAATAAERAAAVRFAREEAADVLAEALWSLICAGRWPGSGACDASPAATASLSERAPKESQRVERTGL
jgi:hypothetical protein